MNKVLSESNAFLRDPKIRKFVVRRATITSARVEGIPARASKSGGIVIGDKRDAISQTNSDR
jgi:hypothetical protein